MNILDIAENSMNAGARLVDISVDEQPDEDILTITIIDDGRGMDPELIASVTDPFTTTRQTRRVGLGIPFFKQAAESTGGSFAIQSEVGKGTRVRAQFGYSHIDRAPLGDIPATVVSLIQGHPDVDLVYRHTYILRRFSLSTRDLRKVLGEVPISSPEAILWIRDYLSEQIQQLYKGAAEL